MMNSDDIQGVGMTSERARDRLLSELVDMGIQNVQVLTAMRLTPRHLFVDEALASRAYENTALPIDAGQTISQPYVVARMTELIMETRPSRVLEIGTGSGYQAAVLSHLVDKVYTVERIKELHVRARELLWELKIRNVYCKYSDGGWGWPEKAPFDAIILTAAPESLPEALLDQLKVGGQLVGPVGKAGSTQQLLRVRRTEAGFEQEVIEPVVFVPMLEGAV
ncbi:MAG: protein-L-isoaspartate(D-aspartate) O-methyltransferase [Thiotrichales bacterium]